MGTGGGGTERRVCVWGYRRLVRALVLRTCFIWRLFIVSGFVSSLVASASHFAWLFRLKFYYFYDVLQRIGLLGASSEKVLFILVSVLMFDRLCFALAWLVVYRFKRDRVWCCHTRLDRVSMLLCVKCRYHFYSDHCDTASLIHTWDPFLNNCFLSKVINDFLSYYFLLSICLLWLSLVLRTRLIGSLSF